MTTGVREVLKAFEALSPSEQQEATTQILRLSTSMHDLPLRNKKAGKRKIVGLGEFSSQVTDLGSNKDHLRGFGT